jgi:hypothetical protein
METILLIGTVSILNIVCFFIGAKTAQTIAKGETIKAPDLNKLNPMTIYKEHTEKKEVEKEKNKIEAILKNIERYDGTEAGQEDIE